MHAQINNLKIGIACLGLIGGSLYKNLVKNSFSDICVYTSNPQTKAAVLAGGYIASDDMGVLADSDVIFVCAPISKTAEMIKNIFKINKNAIFVDVASLKEDIMNEINMLGNCKFIGSHPLAGTENSGFDFSFPELFEGAKWVLTPSNNVNESDINLIKSIIDYTKAITITMEPKEHDVAVALISHAPMLISQSLILSVIGNDNEQLLASSGFRDMTRLAMSNKVMAKDMLELNKDNIKNALKLIADNADKLLDANYFEENIDKIISSRKNLYDENGKNVFRSND